MITTRLAIVPGARGKYPTPKKEEMILEIVFI